VKRLLVPVVLVAVVLGGSACDFSPTAATVNGHVISESQLDTAVSTMANSGAVECAIEMQGEQVANPSGVGSSTVTMSFADQELDTLVNDQLIAADLVKRHITLTSADLTAGRQDFVSALENQNQEAPETCPTGQDLYNVLPPSFVKEQVQSFSDIDVLLAALAGVSISPSALQAYYNANPSEFAETCLSAIVVNTETQAASIRTAVANGASFATEAEQNSLDQTSAPDGGAIGCTANSAIATNAAVAQSLAGLAVNQVSQPFEQQDSDGSTSWVLLQVTGRTQESYSSETTQIRQDILSPHSSLLQTEVERLLREADVDVDPRYGQWKGANGISAPEPPPVRFVLTPAADQPSTAGTDGGLSGLSGS
jgi:hypothetical protein